MSSHDLISEDDDPSRRNNLDHSEKGIEMLTVLLKVCGERCMGRGEVFNGRCMFTKVSSSKKSRVPLRRAATILWIKKDMSGQSQN
jgi:hypothetical protein